MSGADDWVLDLPGTLDRVWAELEAATSDRTSPFRFPSVATVSAEKPEIRTVGLRAADRSRHIVEFYSDTRTAKIAALTANPQVALHVWDPARQFQLRIAAEARLLPADAERWEALHTESRLNYGVHPAPGTPIADSSAFERIPDRNIFVAVECHVQMIDTVVLSEPVHRRARFERADAWRGTWVAP